MGTVDISGSVAVVDGPATLVIRQEAVCLVDANDATAIAVGRVGRATPKGARTLVEVTTSVGSLFAETQPGRRFSRGDAVGLVLSPDQCVVIPAASAASPAAHAPSDALPTTR